MPILAELRRAVYLILLLATMTSPAASTMIRVPDDFSSILYAINAAAGGDTVAVAQGTYYERITLKPDVKLLGGWRSDFALRDPPAHETVIEAGGSLSAVIAQNNETTATVIDGFTIRGGRATTGGGIYLYHSSPTISNNMIIDNEAMQIGGAIASDYGSPIITANTIVGNNAGSYGGAIRCAGGSPIITANVIAGNASGEAASAIFCDVGSNVTITGNVVIDNVTAVGGIGNPGGAVYLVGSGLIEGNTLDGNTGAPCSGIRVQGQYQTVIRRNIVVNGIGGLGIEGRQGAAPQTSCNDVWNNDLGDYFGVLPGSNSFTLDPHFCDGPDRFLREDSPCAAANSPAPCGLIGSRDVGCAVTGTPSGTGSTVTVSPLGHASPNPFTTTTTIAFSAAQTGRTALSIYDAAGRLVAKPFDRVVNPGQYAIAWDGRSLLGNELPAGVYFYRLEGDRASAVRRVALVK